MLSDGNKVEEDEMNSTNSSISLSKCETQAEGIIRSSPTKSDIIKRALTKRSLQKRKKRKLNHNPLDLFKMMLQLKKANINFCISSGPLIQSIPYIGVSRRSSQNQFNSRYVKEHNIRYEELKCDLLKCESFVAKEKMNKKKEFMLLGFEQIKDERNDLPNAKVCLAKTLPQPLPTLTVEPNSKSNVYEKTLLSDQNRICSKLNQELDVQKIGQFAEALSHLVEKPQLLLAEKCAETSNKSSTTEKCRKRLSGTPQIFID